MGAREVHDLPAARKQGQRPSFGSSWEARWGQCATKAGALVRECREELGVTIGVGEVFMEVTHEYPDLTVHLTLFNAVIVSGEPQKLEHNDIRWIRPEEAGSYDFCPADEVILERLRDEYGRA